MEALRNAYCLFAALWAVLAGGDGFFLLCSSCITESCLIRAIPNWLGRTSSRLFAKRHSRNMLPLVSFTENWMFAYSPAALCMDGSSTACKTRTRECRNGPDSSCPSAAHSLAASSEWFFRWSASAQCWKRCSIAVNPIWGKRPWCQPSKYISSSMWLFQYCWWHIFDLICVLRNNV